jgi:hypothetical protein
MSTSSFHACMMHRGVGANMPGPLRPEAKTQFKLEFEAPAPFKFACQACQALRSRFRGDESKWL